jgi:putative membrane protein
VSRSIREVFHNGQLLAVALTLLAMLVSFIGGPYPFEQRLQHVPTLLALVALAWAAHHRAFSNGSFYCILAFWWLHILGARWIYSFVPYDNWLEGVTGYRASELFGWTRNHYDRFVHLAFGALMMPPLVEVLCQRTGATMRLSVGFAFCIVMTVGATYEIVEWQAALWMSPNQAEYYNGQQGDMWDAQKDMGLNAFGAIVAAVIVMAFAKPPTQQDSSS